MCGVAHRPGGALEGERHLEGRQRAPQPLQPVDGRVAAPADGARGGRGRYPLVADLMLQQVEQLVTRCGHAADAERHGTHREPFRQPHPKAVRFLGPQLGKPAEPGFIGGDERGRPDEAHRQHPTIAPSQRGGDELQRCRRLPRRRDFLGDWSELVPRSLEHVRYVGAREGPQAQMHQHDHPECAEPAGLQPREIVSGDVLHDSAAALHHAAVARHKRDAEEMILHGPESLAQRPGGCRGDDGPERPAGEAGGIDGEPGAAVSELLAQLVEPDPRLGGRGQVLGLDGRNAIESARGERQIRRRVTREPGAGAFNPNAPTLLMRGAEEQRHRVGRARGDARDTVGAGLEQGAVAQESADFLDDGHATPAHSRQACSGTTLPGFTR